MNGAERDDPTGSPGRWTRREQDHDQPALGGQDQWCGNTSEGGGVLAWRRSSCLAVHPSLRAQESSVRVYEQDTVIPTYLAGAPEQSPMFFFGRQSQGAEGRIYPYPLYDTLTGKKVDKTYKLVYLENEYVRIGILPEIGGRIFEAVDKTNNYDFFYRQHVIKPALIGLIGAWISGGVEWNIPHHHRASTFLPVQYRIEENERRQQDGLGGRAGAAAPDALGRRLHAAAGQVVPRGVGPDRQPHARGQHDALLRQRRGPRQQGLPGHLPAQHPVRDPSPQARVHHLADRHDAVRRIRLPPGNRRELVQEPHLGQFDVRLELLTTTSSPATTTASKPAR